MTSATEHLAPLHGELLGRLRVRPVEHPLGGWRRLRDHTLADRQHLALDLLIPGGEGVGVDDAFGLEPPPQAVDRIVGPRGLAAGKVELKRRATGERQELSTDAALARLTAS